jgi:hypothetical protein
MECEDQGSHEQYNIIIIIRHKFQNPYGVNKKGQLNDVQMASEL